MPKRCNVYGRHAMRTSAQIRQAEHFRRNAVQHWSAFQGSGRRGNQLASLIQHRLTEGAPNRIRPGQDVIKLVVWPVELFLGDVIERTQRYLIHGVRDAILLG